MSLEFTETQCSQPLLIYGGRSYTLKGVLKNDDKRWICCMCKATLLTSLKDDVLEEGIHTCTSGVSKTEVQKRISTIDKRAREELTPMNEIYKRTFSPVIEMGLEMVTAGPKFQPIKSSLYRSRSKELGSSVLSSERENIILPDSDRYKEQFLLIDDGNMDRILVFCTEEGGKSLLAGSMFYGDGTFKGIRSISFFP